MAFAWDKPNTIEKRRTVDGNPVIERGKATPKEVLDNPYGYRTEDIIFAMTVTLKELIAMAEAEVSSKNVLTQLSAMKR